MAWHAVAPELARHFTLVSDHGTANSAGPMQTWRAWSAHATGQAIRAGHFVPEEAPAETAAALRKFFSAAQ